MVDERIATVAALGATVGAAGFLAWAFSRRTLGPPRAEPLAAIPPPVPVEVPGPTTLPASGPKAKSYPGKRGPKSSVDVQLPPGDGYVIRSASKAWGTGPTIRSIQEAAQRWVEGLAELELAPVWQLKINDISKKGGGPLGGHKSHHEGRDVDVTLQGVEGEKLPAVALPLMLRVFLADPNVQAIFLDWNRQEQAWWALDVNPELDGDVRRELQYPKAPHSGRTRVRHWPGHRGHMHVRFRA